MNKDMLLKECKRKCTCNHNKRQQHSEEVKKRHSESKTEDQLYNVHQITFICFLTDIVSIIAFIFFGSVIFWLAITRILLDSFKKLYNSDQRTKIFFAGLFTILLLSMTTRLILNKRAWKAQFNQELMELDKQNSTVISNFSEPVPILPPPEYLKVTLRDKHLRNLISENKTDVSIQKQFTVTIVDEQKKEVFKTSKDFLVPQMALEMKRPPALIVFLKDIILENY